MVTVDGSNAEVDDDVMQAGTVVFGHTCCSRSVCKDSICVAPTRQTRAAKGMYRPLRWDPATATLDSGSDQ